METWTVTLDNADEPITRERLGAAFTEAYPEPTEFAVRVLGLVSRLPETLAHERLIAHPECEGTPTRATTATITATSDPEAPLSVTFELTEIDQSAARR